MHYKEGDIDIENSTKEENCQILKRWSISCKEKKYRKFTVTTSLLAITIMCFIAGSYLAVRTQTNTDIDIISLTGHYDTQLIFNYI